MSEIPDIEFVYDDADQYLTEISGLPLSALNILLSLSIFISNYSKQSISISIAFCHFNNSLISG